MTGNVVLIPNGNHHLQHGRDALVSARLPLSFEFAGRGDIDEFVLTLLNTDTLADIKTAIEALRYKGEAVFDGKVTLTGSGADTVDDDLVPATAGPENAITSDFANGTDAGFSAEADEDTKRVALTYVSGFHRLIDFVAAEFEAISVTLVPGTSGGELAEDAGGLLPFDFDQEGVFGDSFLSRGGLIAETAVNVTSSNAWTAPATAVTKSDFADVAEDEYIAVTMAGTGTLVLSRVGHEPFFVRFGDIPENDTAAVAAGLAIVREDYIHYLKFTTGGELRFATNSTSTDPNPISFHRVKAGRGEKGPRGVPGVNPELRSVTVSTWQDNDADSAIPGAATETDVAVGRLHPIQFPALSSRRYIHAAVDDAYEMSVFSINGLDQIAQFNEADSGGNSLYHSPRLKAKIANTPLDCLIAVEEASDG